MRKVPSISGYESHPFLIYDSAPGVRHEEHHDGCHNWDGNLLPF